MRNIILLIMVFLILSISGIAQSVPEDVDSTTIQVINQEHKNTRKFLSDELTRQRNEFFKQFEERADYYESRADDMVNDAVWKLGLMWGGVVFLIFGLSSFLNRRLEKRKWNKMLESAKAEIMADVNQKSMQKEEQVTKAQQEVSKQKSELDKKEQNIKQKMDYLQKTRPQLVEMQKRIAMQQKALQDVMSKTDLFEEGKKDGK